MFLHISLQNLHRTYHFPYVVSIITYRKLRKRDASKFHAQLCIALFCMLLFFLVGIDRIENDVVCTIMSLTIQYFTMASVLWMGAEAVLMFQKLIIVFGRITTRYIVTVSLICWCKLSDRPLLVQTIEGYQMPEILFYGIDNKIPGITNTPIPYARFPWTYHPKPLSPKSLRSLQEHIKTGEGECKTEIQTR